MMQAILDYFTKVELWTGYCTTEGQTRATLIDLFLTDVLEHNVWNPHHVRQEYHPSLAPRMAVDYAIMQEDHPVIFIEAKRLGSRIDSRKPIEQIMLYGNSEESVQLLALIDGINWCWFRRGLQRTWEVFLRHNVRWPTSREIPFLTTLRR